MNIKEEAIEVYDVSLNKDEMWLKSESKFRRLASKFELPIFYDKENTQCLIFDRHTVYFLDEEFFDENNSTEE